MPQVIKNILGFLKDESGQMTTENVVWLVVGGLASVSLSLGIVGALRGLGGRTIESIKNSAP